LVDVLISLEVSAIFRRTKFCGLVGKLLNKSFLNIDLLRQISNFF